MTGLTLAFLPSGGQWIVIAVIGLLLFGKRLPEVGRSLGKGIVEFKKGLKGVEDEIAEAEREGDTPRSALPHQQSQEQPQKQVATQPFKFDPYTGKPVEQAVAGESQQVG